MGKQHCICGEEPCTCNNGWGKFATEAELLGAIGDEIRHERWRLAERPAKVRDITVEWMLEEGYRPEEIVETLGVPLSRVRRVARRIG